MISLIVATFVAVTVLALGVAATSRPPDLDD